jgi:predicted RNase H-like nuclease
MYLLQSAFVTSSTQTPGVSSLQKSARTRFALVRSREFLAEVYPHAAMVALGDLPKTIKYKRGSVAAKRVGLNTLRSHLTVLRRAEPPLLRTGVLQELLSADLNELVGQNLKKYEDRLDAVFCAYLACYFWYWGWERNELFGDTESGYILNPKLKASGEFER